MSALAAALAGGAYGVAHGLAPDHCAALATLIVGGRRDRRGAVAASLRFGLGHALVLGGLAALVAFTGALVPPAIDRTAEAIGGATLALLGAFALARGLPLVVHRHGHAHDGEPHHEHWHAHVGAGQEQHRHLHATVVGGVLALGGVRALAVTVAPLLIAGRSPASAISFVVAFGAGVTVAMIAFGLLFQAGNRRVGAARRDLATAVVGGLSLLIGAWWLVGAVT